MLLSMTPLSHLSATPYLCWALATFTVLFCGRRFYLAAWAHATHRSMNMDTLVSLSTATAYLAGAAAILFPHGPLSGNPHVYFETASMIITFILLGRLLEARARDKAGSSLRLLAALQPRHATKLSPDGTAASIPWENICKGDILLVAPGDNIPVDGIITQGAAAVDESMVTGESLPLEKSVGHHVLAGTRNQQGAFRMQAHSVGADTVLASIIRLVEEAQNSKGDVQSLADKVCSFFVPAVIAIALLAAASWYLLGDSPQALRAFVSVLVVACPCALGLATPTALMVGIGLAAQHGILIKDSNALEKLCKVSTLIFDKTGTLTTATPLVSSSQWFVAKTAKLRDILCSLERLSAHPLGNAVSQSLGHGRLVSFSHTCLHPGVGIVGHYAGTTYKAGSAALFPAWVLDVADTWLRGKEDTGVVFFGTEKRLLAAFALEDAIKPHAQQDILELKQQGLDILMATGDRTNVAQRIASQAAIPQFFPQLLPHDKLALVRRYQRWGNVVAMVGDGINDSAALAAADVSIAIGQGSPMAIGSAGITIVSGDLAHIARARQLSQAVLRTIKANLAFAFLYNILAIPLAAGLFHPFTLPPVFAALAMSLSSLAVVTNSLRLKKLPWN
jgi:Cu2+-exporting ATPase